MQEARIFTPSGKPRAAGLGLAFEGKTGSNNSITDVAGVTVGYSTLIEGHGALKVGSGPVRTGVTALLPRPMSDLSCPVFAGLFSLNGNGELTGSHYIEEVGKFALPLTITNTHSCGTTRDATIRWAAGKFPERLECDFALPVAAETYDGFLNDMNGFHITDEHVFQANFGNREDLTILGRRIGRDLLEPKMVQKTADSNLSSIIAVIATDAPLLPHQLKRLARRVGLGVGRTGGFARHGSGDIFIAFSTANADLLAARTPVIVRADLIPDEQLDDLFEAVVRATEEAILNSLVTNEEMAGRDGNFVPALPHDALRALMDLPG